MRVLFTFVYTVCEKADGTAKDICVGLNIKRPQTSEKHLRSNKFMRKSSKEKDVILNS